MLKNTTMSKKRAKATVLILDETIETLRSELKAVKKIKTISAGKVNTAVYFIKQKLDAAVSERKLIIKLNKVYFCA